MHFDTIIIGAGVMGSSAAYWLSKNKEVFLLDQFDLLHTKGSSHGKSRVIRKTYTESYFTDMMKESYQLWNQIQNEGNIDLVTTTGGLDFGKETNRDLQKTLETCKASNIDYKVLNPEQIRTKFPAFKVQDDEIGIYQPETGIVDATKSVETFQKLAVKNGVQISGNERVKSIKENREKIIVETKNEMYTADNLVLSPGSWINNLLNNFNLQVNVEIWKLHFAYYRVLGKQSWYKKENFPVFIHWAKEEVNYGFPIHERSNHVKIAPHINSIIPKEVSREMLNVSTTELLELVGKFVERTFKEISTTPVFDENCYYTMTESEDFIIDFIPGSSNIICLGGFSGHGFKFSPLIGKITSDLLVEGTSNWKLSNFNISNFLRK